jgi:hypothetical protein
MTASTLLWAMALSVAFGFIAALGLENATLPQSIKTALKSGVMAFFTIVLGVFLVQLLVDNLPLVQ